MHRLLSLYSGVPKRSDSSCGDRVGTCCPINTRIEEQPAAPTGGSAKGCSEIGKSGTTEKDTLYSKLRKSASTSDAEFYVKLEKL